MTETDAKNDSAIGKMGEIAKKTDLKPTTDVGKTLQRMKGDKIVPLDELMRLRDELKLEDARSTERFQKQRQEGELLFQELRKIHEEFDELINGASGNVLDGFVQQLHLRHEAVAARIGETVDDVINADELLAFCACGGHFGHLRRALNRAADVGFLQRVSQSAAWKIGHRGEKRLLFTYRGQSYYARDYDRRRLVLLLTDALRELYSRAIDNADRERAEQLSILQSGRFPGHRQIMDLLDPTKELEAPVRFGCVIVDLRAPLLGREHRDGRGSGHIELSIAASDGKKYITVVRFNGSISAILPVESAWLSTKYEDMPAWAANLVQQIEQIATEYGLSDEDIEQMGSKGRRIPSKEERDARWDTLIGGEWRKRNQDWMRRDKDKQEASRAVELSQDDLKTMRGLLRQYSAARVDVVRALHPKFQVSEVVEFALLARDFAHQVDERADRLSGVVHLRVTPVDGNHKQITLVQRVGPITAALPEDGTVWPSLIVSMPQGPVKEPKLPERTPTELPTSLIVHLFRRGFSLEACGIPALDQLVASMSSAKKPAAEKAAKKGKKAPKVESKPTLSVVQDSEQPEQKAAANGE
ncbi:MAG: hypothetical protein ABIG71_04180 [Candidatus Uhrbacteria bacterium]